MKHRLIIQLIPVISLFPWWFLSIIKHRLMIMGMIGFLFMVINPIFFHENYPISWIMFFSPTYGDDWYMWVFHGDRMGIKNHQKFRQKGIWWWFVLEKPASWRSMWQTVHWETIYGHVFTKNGDVTMNGHILGDIWWYLMMYDDFWWMVHWYVFIMNGHDVFFVFFSGDIGWYWWYCMRIS